MLSPDQFSAYRHPSESFMEGKESQIAVFDENQDST